MTSSRSASESVGSASAVACETGQWFETSRRVELDPGVTRVVGQRPAPGRAPVLASERRRADPVQLGECASQVGVGGRRRTPLVDPFEHEPRRALIVVSTTTRIGAVGDREHLRGRDDPGLAEPFEPRRLGREEARRWVSVGLREHRSTVGQREPERLGDVAATEPVHRRHTDTEVAFGSRSESVERAHAHDVTGCARHNP